MTEQTRHYTFYRTAGPRPACQCRGESVWPGAGCPGQYQLHLRPSRVLLGRCSWRRDFWQFGEIRHSERILLDFVKCEDVIWLWGMVVVFRAARGNSSVSAICYQIFSVRKYNENMPVLGSGEYGRGPAPSPDCVAENETLHV